MRCCLFTWLFASYAVVVAIEVRSVARLTAEDRRHTGLTCLGTVRVRRTAGPAEPEPDPDAIHDSGPADATAGVTINVSAAANPAATKRVFILLSIHRTNPDNQYIYDIRSNVTV